jgi:hypothetical protein
MTSGNIQIKIFELQYKMENKRKKALSEAIATLIKNDIQRQSELDTIIKLLGNHGAVLKEILKVLDDQDERVKVNQNNNNFAAYQTDDEGLIHKYDVDEVFKPPKSVDEVAERLANINFEPLFVKNQYMKDIA